MAVKQPVFEDDALQWFICLFVFWLISFFSFKKKSRHQILIMLRGFFLFVFLNTFMIWSYSFIFSHFISCIQGHGGAGAYHSSGQVTSLSRGCIWKHNHSHPHSHLHNLELPVFLMFISVDLWSPKRENMPAHTLRCPRDPLLTRFSIHSWIIVN